MFSNSGGSHARNFASPLPPPPLFDAFGDNEDDGHDQKQPQPQPQLQHDDNQFVASVDNWQPFSSNAPLQHQQRQQQPPPMSAETDSDCSLTDADDGDKITTIVKSTSKSRQMPGAKTKHQSGSINSNSNSNSNSVSTSHSTATDSHGFVINSEPSFSAFVQPHARSDYALLRSPVGLQRLGISSVDELNAQQFTSSPGSTASSKSKLMLRRARQSEQQQQKQQAQTQHTQTLTSPVAAFEEMDFPDIPFTSTAESSTNGGDKQSSRSLDGRRHRSQASKHRRNSSNSTSANRSSSKRHGTGDSLRSSIHSEPAVSIRAFKTKKKVSNKANFLAELSSTATSAKPTRSLSVDAIRRQDPPGLDGSVIMENDGATNMPTKTTNTDDNNNNINNANANTADNDINKQNDDDDDTTPSVRSYMTVKDLRSLCKSPVTRKKMRRKTVNDDANSYGTNRSSRTTRSSTSRRRSASDPSKSKKQQRRRRVSEKSSNCIEDKQEQEPGHDDGSKSRRSHSTNRSSNRKRSTKQPREQQKARSTSWQDTLHRKTKLQTKSHLHPVKNVNDKNDGGIDDADRRPASMMDLTNATATSIIAAGSTHRMPISPTTTTKPSTIYQKAKSSDALSSLISPPTTTRKRRSTKLERLAILAKKTSSLEDDDSNHTGPTTGMLSYDDTTNSVSTHTMRQQRFAGNNNSSGDLQFSSGRYLSSADSDNDYDNDHNNSNSNNKPQIVQKQNPKNDYKAILSCRKDGTNHLLSPKQKQKQKVLSQQRKSKVFGSLNTMLSMDWNTNAGDTIQFTGEGMIERDINGGGNRLVFRLVSEVLPED